MIATSVRSPRRMGHGLPRSVWAALVLLGLGAACSGGDDGSAGRLVVDGRAEVASPGEAADEVTGSKSVQFGQRVKVLEGTAVLRLDRDRELELRAGSNIVLQEVQEGERRVVQPLLLEHDLLVQAPPGARLTVVTEGADVTVSGGAQVSRGPVVVVSSYGGTVALRSGDQTSSVSALREVSITADGAAPAPAPLTYDANDAWDRRFLSDAIELGNELEARSTGFSAQISPTEAPSAEFLLQLLPDLAPHANVVRSRFQAERSPGEAVVGAAIALEGTRGTFDERWAGVFGFRDEGAQWGLVALDQGVTRVPLLALVDGAIGRGPRAFEPIPLPDPSSDDDEVALPSGANGSNGSNGTRPPVTNAPSSATPSVPVPTTVPRGPIPPGPGPLNTGIAILDATINALVDTLSGLLRGLGGG